MTLSAARVDFVAISMPFAQRSGAITNCSVMIPIPPTLSHNISGLISHDVVAGVPVPILTPNVLSVTPDVLQTVCEDVGGSPADGTAVNYKRPLLRLIARYLRDTRRPRSLHALQLETGVEVCDADSHAPTLRGLLEHAVQRVRGATTAVASRTPVSPAAEVGNERLKSALEMAEQCIEQQNHELVSLREALHSAQFELMLLKRVVPSLSPADEMKQEKRTLSAEEQERIRQRILQQEEEERVRQLLLQQQCERQEKQRQKQLRLQQRLQQEEERRKEEARQRKLLEEEQRQRQLEQQKALEAMLAKVEFKPRSAFKSTSEDTIEFEFSFAEPVDDANEKRADAQDEHQSQPHADDDTSTIEEHVIELDLL